MGSVPIAVAMVMKSACTDRPMQGFWIRKEAKEHGTRKLADGYLPDDSDVVIVEDSDDVRRLRAPGDQRGAQPRRAA